MFHISYVVLIEWNKVNDKTTSTTTVQNQK